MKAVSFQDVPLEYELIYHNEDDRQYFKIDSQTGEVTLLRKLTWVSDRRYFFMSVLASDNYANQHTFAGVSVKYRTVALLRYWLIKHAI